MGRAVADALHLPLDVLVVRKLGFPGREELAMGAIAGGGAIMLNEDLIAESGISDEAVKRVAAAERRELARRELAYRGARLPLSVKGRKVILVDDRIATGASTRVAIAVLRKLGAGKILVATPTVSRETKEALEKEVVAVVAVLVPEDFSAVGAYFRDFHQVGDGAVRELLGRGFGGS